VSQTLSNTPAYSNKKVVLITMSITCQQPINNKGKQKYTFISLVNVIDMLLIHEMMLHASASALVALHFTRLMALYLDCCMSAKYSSKYRRKT